MFRRISGSSSMTNIFFMIRSKYRKVDDDSCSFGKLAVEPNLSAVQFGAALDQQQAQPASRARADVAAAMKGFEQLLLICLGDANAAVTNDADGVLAVGFDRDVHGCSRLGIFHGVTQEISENVSEQLLIGVGH